MSPRVPHRFYYPGHLDRVASDVVELASGESHHLLRVLRLKPGTQIDLFDASGLNYSAVVEKSHRGIAQVRLLMAVEIEPSLHHPLNLAVAVIKRRAMDWMIEKLSELNVDTIQPLLARRSVGVSDLKSQSDAPDRWDRIALAAAKQCGRNTPLSILAPEPVDAWLGRTRPPAHAVFAHKAVEAKPIGEWLRQRAAAELPLWIAIGPEGGWTPEEVTAFVAAGFNPVTLGDLTLRAETAAMAAAAVCRLF